MRARRAEASRALPGALAPALLGLLLALGGCSVEQPTPFFATEVSGVNYGHELTIPDTAGEPRRLKDFEDRVSVVFLGFASCPDVCPTTLLRLKAARAALGAQADRIQVLLVTVDPERDTPERLRAYLDNFDPSFIGLRPEPADLTRVVRAFHAVAEKVPTGAGADYTIDHSSSLYVYDRGARLRLLAPADISVEDLASDLRRLANEAS